MFHFQSYVSIAETGNEFLKGIPANSGLVLAYATNKTTRTMMGRYARYLSRQVMPQKGKK